MLRVALPNDMPPRHGPLQLPEKSPRNPEAPTPTWGGLTTPEVALSHSTKFLQTAGLADRKMAALDAWQSVGRAVVGIPVGTYVGSELGTAVGKEDVGA